MAYSPALYRHELDRTAFSALNAFPVFLKLQEAYLASFDEKAAKIDLLSTAVRISGQQFGEVYALLPPICGKLDIPIPEIYYVQSKELNAWTGGNTEPYICVTSRLVNELPHDLIAAVLAHECGHIACKHVLYRSMAGNLTDGVGSALLLRAPVLRALLTPAMSRALKFWDRCSELSADRAAVLCDGNADRTIDALLRLHGYKNIDRGEFLKQALDLKAFVNDSTSNRLMELMLTQNEAHPRLATRAYECYEWSRSERFSDILCGTFTADSIKDEPPTEKEVISAELTVAPSGRGIDDVNRELERVNAELERCTSKADKADYELAVGCGILAGAIDALYVGEITISGDDIGLSHEQVNRFITAYAKERGFEGDRLKGAIGYLEKEFKVAQDNVWKGPGIGVSAKNHHLADLAHHPTPLGLLSSIVVQFLRVGTFVSRDGKWHFLLVDTTKEDIIGILVPAVITGLLNWLVAATEKSISEDSGVEIPKAIRSVLHLAASTPMLVEIAKCADNWFGHLVSDMGGSKNTPGKGMGIPGIFISLLYEIASLPVLRDSGLPRFVDELYEKQKIDLRHEIPLYKSAGKQAVPVVFNELLVRVVYFVKALASEAASGSINWRSVLPFRNRTVDRMLTVSTMTFTVADTADAAIHAAIESGGNWVLFAGSFVTRFNYVGAGRSAVAIVREISSEKRETQLIHEKMLLSEEKAAMFLGQLQDFKARLEEKVSDYLAEDLEAFAAGFEQMDEGLASGDSDLVIRGNLTIQKVLGREPQFKNQEEFDALMDSDTPFKL